MSHIKCMHKLRYVRALIILECPTILSAKDDIL